jgi:exodeoxyribonuclease V alpha subunit
MIASQCIPVVTLTQIFRQAAGSKIITNAHAINEGIFPDIYGGEKSDFFFLEAEESADVAKTILDLTQTRLPQKYRFDPLKDIQVLAPMKRGPIGIASLNQLLQEKLNPNKEALFRSGVRYQLGDKVMQIRNNYDKEVYNGDVGFICEVNLAEQTVIVAFDGIEIPYEFHELDELSLAYVVSIHKYQGSECPCIIIPIHTSHFMMLHRNLLYTGVTRGRKLVVLVGSKKALAIAVKNNQVAKRFSGLKQALVQL